MTLAISSVTSVSQEHDAILHETRPDIVGALASVGLFDDGGGRGRSSQNSFVQLVLSPLLGASPGHVPTHSLGEGFPLFRVVGR